MVIQYKYHIYYNIHDVVHKRLYEIVFKEMNNKC